MKKTQEFHPPVFTRRLAGQDHYFSNHMTVHNKELHYFTWPLDGIMHSRVEEILPGLNHVFPQRGVPTIKHILFGDKCFTVHISVV